MFVFFIGPSSVTGQPAGGSKDIRTKLVTASNGKQTLGNNLQDKL